MNEPVRVMLLLSSLHGGGAERVAVHLVNRCDAGLVDVRMGLLRKAGPFLPDADADRIDASPIGQDWLAFEGHNSGFYRPRKLLAGAVLAPANVASMIRAHRPHVVMSFLKGMSVLTYFVLKGMGPSRPRWIVREGKQHRRGHRRRTGQPHGSGAHQEPHASMLSRGGLFPRQFP
jgi:hypothetical protein